MGEARRGLEAGVGKFKEARGSCGAARGLTASSFSRKRWSQKRRTDMIASAVRERIQCGEWNGV